ncbi:MAG TPA: hypothetical protein VGL61_09515 [Kofleriaceae bacterium]|jgi:hypothetical protein
MTRNLQKQNDELASKPAPLADSSLKPVAPKGDPGKKPVIEAQGQNPIPKGYKFPNPTFNSATRYATEYFEHQADVASIMGQAADAAFKKFQTRTSEEYNRQGVTPAQLFSAALSLAPAGAAILGALQALKTAEKLKRLAETVERVSRMTEKVSAVREAKEKSVAMSEASESQDEGQERGNFAMETADTLLEMALERVGQRWEKQQQLDVLMDAIEFVDPSIDLRKVIVDALGPLPTIAELKAAAKSTEDDFEYLLYYQYYAESGKATFVVESGIEELSRKSESDDNNGMRPNEFIENVPQPVLDRIDELHKTGDFAQGVKAFHTEMRSRNRLRH